MKMIVSEEQISSSAIMEELEASGDNSETVATYGNDTVDRAWMPSDNQSRSSIEVARENPDGSGIIYPPSLPNDRGMRAQKLYCALIVILFGGGGAQIFNDEGTIETFKFIFTVGLVGSALISCTQLVNRICLLFEEIHHVPGRYSDKKAAFFKAFNFNRITSSYMTFSILMTLFLCFTKDSPIDFLWSKGQIPVLTSLCATLLLSNLVKMDESVLNTSLLIEQMKSLDYGSGMAYNYFYGYLRLILPEAETRHVKGIKTKIETFINHHHLQEGSFPVKKLFILIPQDLYTPPDLKDVSVDPPHNDRYWMEAAVSLEPQEMDRAGVKQRIYKNSVYKIRNLDCREQQPVYVCAEGATPLKTFYEVIESNPKMSSVFKEHKHEIVSAFYKTLRDIIRNNDDCRDVCEIIYYVDKENGKKVNVARVILQRIQELQGSTFKTEANIGSTDDRGSSAG